MRYTLYSKLVSGTRNKKIVESDDLTSLYDKGLKLLKKDVKRERNYFIVEHGVRAIKIQ
jgi:hypothetical protein